MKREMLAVADVVRLAVVSAGALGVVVLVSQPGGAIRHPCGASLVGLALRLRSRLERGRGALVPRRLARAAAMHSARIARSTSGCSASVFAVAASLLTAPFVRPAALTAAFTFLSSLPAASRTPSLSCRPSGRSLDDSSRRGRSGSPSASSSSSARASSRSTTPALFWTASRPCVTKNRSRTGRCSRAAQPRRPPPACPSPSAPETHRHPSAS
jgi:hypothetical protein